MADGLVWSVIKQLGAVIEEHALKEARRVLDVDDQIKSLKRKLVYIQPVLLDVDKKVENELMKVWVEDMKDVTYDIEDVLSDWTTAILKVRMDLSTRKMKRCFLINFSCFSGVGVHHRRNIAVQIEEINGKLAEISSQINQFKFTITNEEHERRRPQTSSYVDPSKMEVVGRGADEDKYVRELLQERNTNVHVVSVTGLGGIGKTALARQVYNSVKLSSADFKIKRWVFVSEGFDQIKVAKAMLEDVDQTLSDLNRILEQVRKSIQGKKFLFVLDDVRTVNREDWDPFSNILQAGALGSRILLTTRNQKIADMMGATPNDQLLPLSKEYCRSLFKQIAPKADEKKFKEVGEKIADKCKGFPLAIQMLGNLVRDLPTVQKWGGILGSEMWAYEDAESGVSPALLLSYHHLPTPVKRCFSYCANFYKDDEIEANNLIKLWMAQGYLISGVGKRTMEESGREYLETLAARCFLLVVKKDDDSGDIKTFKMQSVAHDFAIHLSKKESLRITLPATSEYIRREMDSEGKRFRHLTLIRDKSADFPDKLEKTEKVHTFVIQSFHDCPVALPTLVKTRSKVFTGLKCVKALGLSRNNLHELPKEVGELLNLRFVNLSHNSLRDLPDAVCDLYNLQTLMLSGCKHLSKLPQGMHKLVNLRHLEIDGTESLKSMPKGIKELGSLQTLSKFIIGGGGIDHAKEEACTVEDLGNLDFLCGSLKIEGLGRVESKVESENAKLNEKAGLLKLHLDFSPLIESTTETFEALELPSALKCLTVTSYGGNRLPNWIASLMSLRELRLEDCTNCLELPPLGKLAGLETLYIERLEGVKSVGHEFLGVTAGLSTSTAFPLLKKLVIDGMSNLVTWSMSKPEGEVVEDIVTIMPCLNSLRIYNCEKLKELPNPILKQLQTVQKQRKLFINNCNILKQELEKDGSMLSQIDYRSSDALLGK